MRFSSKFFDGRCPRRRMKPAMNLQSQNSNPKAPFDVQGLLLTDRGTPWTQHPNSLQFGDFERQAQFLAGPKPTNVTAVHHSG